jgi:hypothetical protein
MEALNITVEWLVLLLHFLVVRVELSAKVPSTLTDFFLIGFTSRYSLRKYLKFGHNRFL